MGPNGATGAVYLAHRDLPQRPVALTRAPGVSLCFWAGLESILNGRQTGSNRGGSWPLALGMPRAVVRKKRGQEPIRLSGS